jgi:Trk K+ transport system NAD-binding subunit
MNGLKALSKFKKVLYTGHVNASTEFWGVTRMSKMLIVSTSYDGKEYFQRARSIGLEVYALDCFEGHHRQLKDWYGSAMLEVAGRRADVVKLLTPHQFDVAVIHEDDDYVRSALIAQSLRDCGIPLVLVVTSDASRVRIYRRTGAHRVIVANSASEAWNCFEQWLVANQPA